MSNTEKDLAAAFAGESQANRKYLAFAKQADAEGYPQVAKLFRAAAEAETIHALAHLKTLGMIKSTAENLKAAVAGETYEFTEMYPEFIKDAEAEKNSAAIRTFTLANGAEKVHAELYQRALEKIQDQTEIEYYICPFCGNLHIGKPTEKCAVCGAAANIFEKVE